MNNDLKEQDLTFCGDPMFDDILKDLLALNTAQCSQSTLAAPVPLSRVTENEQPSETTTTTTTTPAVATTTVDNNNKDDDSSSMSLTTEQSSL